METIKYWEQQLGESILAADKIIEEDEDELRKRNMEIKEILSMEVHSIFDDIKIVLEKHNRSVQIKSHHNSIGIQVHNSGNLEFEYIVKAENYPAGSFYFVQSTDKPEASPTSRDTGGSSFDFHPVDIIYDFQERYSEILHKRHLTFWDRNK